MWKFVLAAFALLCAGCASIPEPPAYWYASPGEGQPYATVTLTTEQRDNGSMGHFLQFTPPHGTPWRDDYRTVSRGEGVRIHADQPMNLVAKSVLVPGLNCENGVTFTPRANHVYRINQPLIDDRRCRVIVVDQATGMPVQDATFWSPPRVDRQPY